MTRSDFYVYILFRLNGLPCYVGKGAGDRWERHEGRAKHKNKHLGSIIDQARAAGKELPKIKAAEGLTEESAFDLERLLIGCIGRGEDGPLVNLTDGGDGPAGFKPSAEQLAHHSAIRQGRKHSDEWRANISAGLKGKPKSAAHSAAVGAAHKGKKRTIGWWSTAEGRAKQRANNPGNSGKKHSEETKAVIQAARFRQTNVSTVGQFKPKNSGDQVL